MCTYSFRFCCSGALPRLTMPPLRPSGCRPTGTFPTSCLANTIFAQIFAGSPRERDGFIGSLLRGVVWITLAIAPILILLAFQFRFLPYHSETVTLTHRFLILIELMAFFLIWPLALDARRDFQWPNVRESLKHLPASLERPDGSSTKRGNSRLWFWRHAASLTACFLYIIICFLIASFSGEPHVNLLTGHAWSSVQCDRCGLHGSVDTHLS